MLQQTLGNVLWAYTCRYGARCQYCHMIEARFMYSLSHYLYNVDVLLTVHLSIILEIDQLNAQIIVL